MSAALDSSIDHADDVVLRWAPSRQISAVSAASGRVLIAYLDWASLCFTPPLQNVAYVQAVGQSADLFAGRVGSSSTRNSPARLGIALNQCERPVIGYSFNAGTAFLSSLGKNAPRRRLGLRQAGCGLARTTSGEKAIEFAPRTAGILRMRKASSCANIIGSWQVSHAHQEEPAIETPCCPASRTEHGSNGWDSGHCQCRMSASGGWSRPLAQEQAQFPHNSGCAPAHGQPADASSP